MSKKRILATLDIETKDGLKGCIFGMGGFYMKYKGSEETISLYSCPNYKEFFDEIFKRMEGKKVLCFIHNEDFDIRFVLKYCIEEMKVNPKVIQTNSKILQIIIPDTQIIFRDSLQFLLCSQEKAEETFLEQKIKIDVNFVETIRLLNSPIKQNVIKGYKILKERVESDVIGLYMVMKKFKEIFKEDYNINPFSYVTLPSLSVGIFRRKLKKDFGLYLSNLNPYFDYNAKGGYAWKSEQHQKMYDWTRKSYFGGRNEIYNLNYLNDVYYYDFNSLYPSICIKKPFPNPQKYFIMDYPELEFFQQNIRGKYLYIIEAEVEENISYPVLPTRDKNNSVKFVNGNKTGVWCSPQFDRFTEFEENNVIKINKLKVYTEQEYYFKSFMKESFDRKKKFSKLGNKARVMIEKIKMNSLTGKPAQKYKKEQWVLYNEEYIEEIQFSGKGYEILEFSKDYKLIKMEIESLKDFMVVEWSSFTTSYAQTEVHRTFYKCEEENIEFYYCDTDCIFTNKALETNANLSYLIGDNELQLKNEIVPEGYNFIKEKGLYYNPEKEDFISIPKFDEAKFYLPKTYVLKKDEKFQIRVKGISLFMIYESLGIELVHSQSTKSQLQKLLNSFDKIEKLLFDTGVQMNRFLKYKSSLRRNSKLISHSVIKKKVKKIYDKRKITEDFKTVPFTFQEMENLEHVKTENLNRFLSNDKMNYVITEQDRTKVKGDSNNQSD